jgi:hypothetical protein
VVPPTASAGDTLGIEQTGNLPQPFALFVLQANLVNHGMLLGAIDKLRRPKHGRMTRTDYCPYGKMPD